MFKKVLKKAVILVLIILLSTGIFSYTALANGGPVSRGGYGTGFLRFDDSSGIELVEESVAFNFASLPGGGWYASYAGGTMSVVYKLRNKENIDKKFDMLFILPVWRNDDSSVKLNGNMLQHKSIENLKDINLENWAANFEDFEISQTPRETLKVYPAPGALQIPIEMKAGETVTLEISSRSTVTIHTGIGIVNQQCFGVYYLTPAKFWEGQAKVNLKIIFPNNKRVGLNSNIPLNKNSDGSYEVTLDKLPDTEWMFTFWDSSRLLFGTNNASIHNSLVLLASLFMAIILLILQVKLTKRWITSIGYPLIFLFIIKFLGKTGSSGYGDLIIRPLIFLTSAIGLIILYLLSKGLMWKSKIKTTQTK